MLRVIGGSALLILVYATGWFVVAVRAGRNDVADVAWGLGYVLLCGYLVLTQPVDGRDLLVYSLVTVWGLRLSAHIHVRNRGKEEDFRYRRWREEWGPRALLRSYLQVFLLQGGLLLVIAAPLYATALSAGPGPGPLAWAGAGVWAGGFLFEAVADWQLLRYKRDPDREGRIMTGGLWRYTRHPNYFGEVALWWGIYLAVLPVDGGLWALASPLTLTVLILFVSGIPMLEEKYRGDPEFEAYRERTSVFFPLPPREGG